MVDLQIIMENYYILLAVGCMTHLIRTGYEIFKSKKIISADNKIIFTIIFADMALLWISWFKMCELDPVMLPLPEIIQLIGFIIAAVGLFIFFVALFKLKTLENYNGNLVTTGIFKYLRHPMYLAFLFWLFGYAIFRSAGISMIVAVLFAANILYWRFLEEKDLSVKYKDYEQYKKKTIF